MFMFLTLLSLLVPALSQQVLDITASNFASVGGDTLVKFYAPWCGHCKRFAPAYEEIALAMKDESTTVGRVDGASERGLSTIFNIQGFPTIYYIHPDGSTVYKYGGQRSKEAVMAFAQGGYKNVEPLPYLTGPFGVVGQLKWQLLAVGLVLLDGHEWLAGVGGMGKVAAGVILTVGGMFCTAVFVIALTIATTQAAKEKKN